MGPEPTNPVSAPLQDFQKDLAINTVSAYAAAQAAVVGFSKLPRDARKTFIYTGNGGNTCVSPIPFLSRNWNLFTFSDHTRVPHARDREI